MPGPLPKRSTERRRRNKVPGETTVRMDGRVAVPGLPKDTHSVARRWYNSLKTSGQSQFYEPSDWAAALYLARLMTENLNQERVSSMMASMIWNGMNDLLTTEAARRKARLEVERGGQEEVSDQPTAIDEYRKALGV